MMMWLNMDRRFLGELLLTIAQRRAERRDAETRSPEAGTSCSFKLEHNKPRDTIATASKARRIQV